ncbi:MAG: TlpA disulfide reductase family protein [Pseudomonadota bacterium]
MRSSPSARLAAALLYGAASLAAIAPAAIPLTAAAGDTLAPGEREALVEMAGQALPNLVIHDEARDRYETGFETGDGQPVTLADFAGDVVVMNIWATWCPPCVHEMPSLDRLAATMAGSDVQVITVSVDRTGVGRVERFFADTGNEAHPRIEALEIYIDKPNRLPREAAVIGLPVTMILDRQGREIARLTGDAEWDAPAVVAMLRHIAQLTESGIKDASAADPRVARGG